jgi:hypothetical protein
VRPRDCDSQFSQIRSMLPFISLAVTLDQLFGIHNHCGLIVDRSSIFGFFNVPAAAYPWALLLACQLLMPGASFLGHLCGVLVSSIHLPLAVLWGALELSSLVHLPTMQAPVQKPGIHSPHMQL